MIADVIRDAETKMSSAVEHAKEEFGAIRTGRAHPAMFNKITAEYYGVQTPLQQLATIQIPEARLVTITPFDKGAMANIEKAVRDSDLGVNPASDGHQIRCSLPELTEERRKEYVKLTRTKAEEARVSVRNARRAAKDGFDKLLKDKEVGEDEVSRAEKELDATTKKHTDQIDELVKNKEVELHEV